VSRLATVSAWVAWVVIVAYIVARGAAA
jgi:hypothetical protein